MSKHKRFDAAIEAQGILRRVDVPAAVSEALAPGRRVAVAGTLNGYPFRTHVVSGGAGGYRLYVDKDTRLGAAVDTGDYVTIELERVDEPPPLAMPPQLDEAIGGREHLRKAFAELPPGLLEHLVTWLGSAKRPETQARYVERAIEMLTQRVERRR